MYFDIPGRAIRYLARKYREERQQRLFLQKRFLDAIRAAIDAERMRLEGRRRLFVVGNGPSLNLQDMELLRGEYTICSNAFYHMYPKISWRPDIVTVEDPLPAIDNKRFFCADNKSLKLVPYDLHHIFGDQNPTLVYINFLRSYRHWSRPGWPYFSSDIRDVSYWGGTVSFLSLQIAASLGVREIYLIGTDLSYVVPDSAVRKGIEILSTEKDPNHFHGDYFGAGKKWHIPETDRMNHSFVVACGRLKERGIGLYNATEGGNLEGVPRVSFEGLFS